MVLLGDDSPVIRPAAEADLQRIHEIAVGGWRPIFERYRLIVGDRMWNDIWGGWEKNWFPPDPAKYTGRAIVTELGGQVVGFATWWFHSDDLAEVGGNAVDPKFQGRGVGSRQVQWIVNMFRERGCKCARVHTGIDPAHGPARAEYRKAGLRRPVLNSLYFNYLDETARMPVRSSLACRWASADDRDLLGRFTRAAWPPIYDSIRESLGERIFNIAFPNPIEQKVAEFGRILEQTPNKIRMVLENGRAAGFAILNDEPAKKVGEISALAVSPEYQGRGIGAALCMDVFDIFRERGMSHARLKASPGEVNSPTRQLCWNVGMYRELPYIDYYMAL